MPEYKTHLLGGAMVFGVLALSNINSQYLLIALFLGMVIRTRRKHRQKGNLILYCSLGAICGYFMKSLFGITWFSLEGVEPYFILFIFVSTLIASVEPDLDYSINRKSWSLVTIYYIAIFLIIALSFNLFTPQNQVVLLGGILFILGFCLFSALLLHHRNSFSHSIFGAFVFSLVNAIITNILFMNGSERLSEMTFVFHMFGYLSHLLLDRHIELGG